MERTNNRSTSQEIYNKKVRKVPRTIRESFIECIDRYSQNKEAEACKTPAKTVLKKKFIRNSKIILTNRKNAELVMKKKKAKRNKCDLPPSHIKVLQQLKKHTDLILPSLKEKQELGMDLKEGTSLSQEHHFQEYIKIKFGLDMKNYHGEGTYDRNPRKSQILNALRSFERFRRANVPLTSKHLSLKNSPRNSSLGSIPNINKFVNQSMTADALNPQNKTLLYPEDRINVKIMEDCSSSVSSGENIDQMIPNFNSSKTRNEHSPIGIESNGKDTILVKNNSYSTIKLPVLTQKNLEKDLNARIHFIL
ncbi:unnamed protein product [Moneuplotes crassus]|uniref:Uncharacterized protein n=1 Tax=Euplotes crassus TaxID=5936 RepID=A0AAD1U3B6_EUPCR|nr:unnamed protein product [Moneuplotes crassus]